MSSTSIFLDLFLSDDVVDFSSNFSIFKPFVGVVSLLFSVLLSPDVTDDDPAMSTMSVFLGTSVSDDIVGFSSNVSVVFKPFVGVASLPLSFSVCLLPERTDVVTEYKRLSPNSSGDFVPPFTVTLSDEFAVERTTSSRCTSDWPTAGICGMSVLKGISVPLTSFSVFKDLVSDSGRVADLVSC